MHPDFKKILAVRFFTAFALSMQAVIVGWRIYELRPEAIYLGLIGLSEAVPAIGFAFFSGLIIDRSRPLSVLRFSILVLLINAVLLCSSVWFSGHLSETTQLVLLFSGVFISGAGRSFISPAIFSLIPFIVEKSKIPVASAWRSGIWQVAAVVGPAFGGLVYGWAGAKWAFVGLPVSLIIGLLLIFRISPHSWQVRNQANRGEPVFKSINQGWIFIWKTKPLLGAMTLDMFSVLFGGVTAILPIFADQVFHVGPSGLGVMRAAPSVGSGLVAVWFALKPMKHTSGALLLKMVTGFGLATIGFALTNNYSISLLCLFLLGAFDGVSVIIRDTIGQLMTPDGMRGRVASLESMFISSSNEIGAFESGLAAQFLGLIPSVLFGGVMTLVVVGVCILAIPELGKAKLEHN